MLNNHFNPQILVLDSDKRMNWLYVFQVGNAWIDYETNNMGMYDYFWTHALNSDEYNAEIHAKCDFSNETSECIDAQNSLSGQLGNINIYDIYAPLCHGTNQTANPSDSVSFHQYNLSWILSSKLWLGRFNECSSISIHTDFVFWSLHGWLRILLSEPWRGAEGISC